MLSPAGAPAFVRLRDDTCRSYPVWTLAGPLRARIEALDDEARPREPEHRPRRAARGGEGRLTIWATSRL